MNLHPIVVHFPIALLIVYAVIEVVSFFLPKRSEKLYMTKIICLWVWVIWSFFALQSGEIAQDIHWKSDLIHTHEQRAEKSHIMYMILAIYYLVKIVFEEKIWGNYRVRYLQDYFATVSIFFHARWVQLLVMLISIIGVLVLTIVGALGWAISRGTWVGDPVSDWAVNTFVK
jgi:uncharacterized membrane protein